ncbi:MAG: ADP-ribosylglycohydrolase family protein [Acidimicrobiia bacterium]|nr:ADP-ribosylglycohydrolase family protein [Acidimicrobiia bacterium]
MREGGGSRRRRINDSKGCGGVMRVAPVGLTANDPFELGATAASITHMHPTGWLAAGAFAALLSRVLNGADLSAACNIVIENLDEMNGGEETANALRAALEVAESAPVGAETVERLGAGWVAEEALAIGVYATLVADDFSHGLNVAVTHSGDSDSTGSIAGNLLGAMHGEEALPPALLDDLEGRDVIRQVAIDLAGICTGAAPDHDRYPRVPPHLPGLPRREGPRHVPRHGQDPRRLRRPHRRHRRRHPVCDHPHPTPRRPDDRPRSPMTTEGA